MKERVQSSEFESRAAEDFYWNVMRRLTPAQKWEAAFELWQMAVDAARARVRADHPEWPETQVRAVVARRIMEANGAARILDARRAGA